MENSVIPQETNDRSSGIQTVRSILHVQHTMCRLLAYTPHSTTHLCGDHEADLRKMAKVEVLIMTDLIGYIDMI